MGEEDGQRKKNKKNKIANDKTHQRKRDGSQ
jgi:hypothetical protein